MDERIFATFTDWEFDGNVEHAVQNIKQSGPKWRLKVVSICMRKSLDQIQSEWWLFGEAKKKLKLGQNQSHSGTRGWYIGDWHRATRCYHLNELNKIKPVKLTNRIRNNWEHNPSCEFVARLIEISGQRWSLPWFLNNNIDFWLLLVWQRTLRIYSAKINPKPSK